MTVLQTVLTFVGIPAAVFAVIAALVYGSGGRSKKRYRPGDAYEYAPVWFLARPENVSIAQAADYVASDSATLPKELEGAQSNVGSDRPTAKGGASGNW